MNTTSLNLSGNWRGQYFYAVVGEPTWFTASIQDNGGAFNGKTSENSMGLHLGASISGQRNGSSVSFIKLYDVHDEQYDEVIYQGTVLNEGDKIQGEWKISGDWFGTFSMTRERQKLQALEQEVFYEL